MDSSKLVTRRTVAVIVFAALAPALLMIRPEFVEPGAAYLLVATIWIALVPPFLYLQNLEARPLPLMPLTCGFYVIFFAVPPFLIDRRWWSASPDASGTVYGVSFDRITTFTAGLVLAGITACVIAYLAASPIAQSRLPRLRLPSGVSWAGLRLVGWLFAAVHVAFLYVPALRSMSSLAQAMAPIGLFAVGILFIAGHKGKMLDGEKLLYWMVFIPLEVFIHVYEGLLTPILLLFAFLLTLYLHFWRKLSILLVVTVLFGLYGFSVLKLSNAFIIDKSATGLERVSEKISAFGVASTFFSASRADDPAVAGLDKNVLPPIIRRIALIVLLQYCVDRTPAVIPYLGGETLNNLLTNAIPRMLWKDKPTEIVGQWFGHKYRILQPADRMTSVNLPWLVEFYINFGLLGVVVGMTLVGLLVAMLEAIFLRSEHSLVEAVTGWSLLFRMSYPESNLSLMLGGFLTQAIFFCCLLYGVLWLITRSQPAE